MQADEDDLPIPAFLCLTREQRRAGWERWLASCGGKYTDPWREGQGGVKRDWTRPRSLTDEEWAYWQQHHPRVEKAEAKREEDEQRFIILRQKAKEDREARAAVRDAVRASMSSIVASQRQSATTTARGTTRKMADAAPAKSRRRKKVTNNTTKNRRRK